MEPYFEPNYNTLWSALDQLSWLSDSTLFTTLKNESHILRGPNLPKELLAFQESGNVVAPRVHPVSFCHFESPNHPLPLAPVLEVIYPARPQCASDGSRWRYDSRPSLATYFRADDAGMPAYALHTALIPMQVLEVPSERMPIFFDLCAAERQSKSDQYRGIAPAALRIAERTFGRRKLKRALKQKIKDAQGNATFWLGGGPGTGKTALVSRMATELAKEGLPVVCVLVRHAGPGGPRADVLRLLHRVCLDGDIPDNPDVIIEALRSRPRDRDSNARIVVFLDGVDELGGAERDVLSLPGDVALPSAGQGITWVFSGRPVDWICGRGGALHEPIHLPAQENGLSEVDHETLATWLKESLPATVRARLIGLEVTSVQSELSATVGARSNGKERESANKELERAFKMAIAAYERDGASDMPQTPVPAWLQHLHFASGGNALFISLLIRDLATGREYVGDVVPPGINAYLDELMDRAGIEDAAAHVPLVACFMALAPAPVPRSVLADLLVLRRQSETLWDSLPTPVHSNPQRVLASPPPQAQLVEPSPPGQYSSSDTSALAPPSP